MPEEKQTPKEVQAERVYEQPPDAISFYCDLGQILSTGNELVMQFYEAVPGPPGPTGQITKIRTRLRATITVSFPHAQNIGKLLVEKSKRDAT
jgi:hypothetical protein